MTTLTTSAMPNTFPGDLQWDDGQLVIKPRFAELFQRHQLTTFSSIMSQPELLSAKAARKDRLTFRFELPGRAGPHVFYLKWHGPAPWKDYVKPWLQGKTPIIGARNEWLAMHQFQAAGVASMNPVAFGTHRQESFVIIEGLSGYVKLSELITSTDPSTWHPASVDELIDHLAIQTARMHAARLHHQDYYLGHLMVPHAWTPCLLRGEPTSTRLSVRVIDLGRAQQPARLATRWIVKDLAQLNYSARILPDSWRARFLLRYLSALPGYKRESLTKSVLAKTARIAEHSRKHRM